jgi:hypothetical protein
MDISMIASDVAGHGPASCFEQGFGHYPVGVCSGRVEGSFRDFGDTL